MVVVVMAFGTKVKYRKKIKLMMTRKKSQTNPIKSLAYYA